MNKLQNIISIILDSEIVDSEKINLITKVVEAGTDADLSRAISQVADFLDAKANEYDEKAQVYEKYENTYASMQQDIDAVEEKYNKTSVT